MSIKYYSCLFVITLSPFLSTEFGGFLNMCVNIPKKVHLKFKLIPNQTTFSLKLIVKKMNIQIILANFHLICLKTNNIHIYNKK